MPAKQTNQTHPPTDTHHADYIQALQDESRIRAEKIGSGNWYWSFVSDDKLAIEKALLNAQGAHEKALALDSELRAKIAESECQRKGDEEMMEGSGETREQLLGEKKLLEGEVAGLKCQLADYSDSDPAELERKGKEAGEWRGFAEGCTDDVYSMEGWLKETTGGGEAFVAVLREVYAEEWDEEANGLRELV